MPELEDGEPDGKPAKPGKKKIKEEAPKGKKYERMIKHIKRSYAKDGKLTKDCLLYTSPSPRDGLLSRMPSSA